MTTLPAPTLEQHVLELSRLLQRQRNAFRAQMNPTLEQRSSRLARLEGLLAERLEQFAELISNDFGNRSRHETLITEGITLQAALRHARAHLRAWMRPRRAGTPLALRPGRSLLLRQPLGVVGIISPWNYPLQLALGPLIGALAAGNRALIKPSELVPSFSQALREEIGARFAEDEVAVVTGDAQVGQAFSRLPFDHLVFTGSTAVGRLVAIEAAKNLTPVTLELGGKSPAIIDASCDLELAAGRLAWGKLINAGQTCIAPDYALVPKGQLQTFAEAMQRAMCRLYPSFHANPDYTSIVSERHLARLRALVADAVERGARVIELEAARDGASGRQMAPTLLLDVNDSMRVMQEEIFGPLLPIVPYESLRDAIEHVNRHDRPLALYWFGNERSHRQQVLEGTIAGGVTVNDALVHNANDALPFGGVGPSGQGHYHGEFGFRQFSKEKPVFVQSRFSAGRLLYPPYRPWLRRVLRVVGRML